MSSSLADSTYYEFEKIDAHLHLNSSRHILADIALEEKFSLVTINTEVPFFPNIQEQAHYAQQVNQNHATNIGYITTFSTNHWGETGWQDLAIEQIENGINNGAIGVKIWKNVGMELKDKNGKYVMADHPSFDPIYIFLSENRIPLLGHLGEPKNCWLPLDEMTVTSDRDYFSRHPEYHMYKNPEMPSYEDQLKARDQVLEKHPKLQFVGAHLASLEWSVIRIAEWLEEFPNAGVDLAERICHLQYQAGNNFQKVKNFIEAYQDRIIYGSDQIDDGTITAGDLKKELTQKWKSEFDFFAMDSVQNTDNVPFSFKGLGLSKDILKKIFRGNALTYYPQLEKSHT